jgi:hypothetical protein
MQMSVSFDKIFDYGDDEVIPEPNFLTITEMLAKPFSFVCGEVPQRGFNPFRKKSGILSVLAKQDHRSRLMGKTGSLHTVGLAEGNADKYLKDIFISIIDLVNNTHSISIIRNKLVVPSVAWDFFFDKHINLTYRDGVVF